MTRAGRVMAQQRMQSNGGDARSEASKVDAVGRGHAARSTVTVHVQIAFQQRRGRKVLVAPNGTGQEPLEHPRAPPHTLDELTPAVGALARAFRWRRLLETGAVATVHEIATAENINPSYVSRVLRLTLLAPEMVEAVTGGIAVSGAATLDRLMLPFPTDWCGQALLD